MNYVIIQKSKFTQVPPVISTIKLLVELGHEVTIIDEYISDYWKDELNKWGVKYYEIPKTNSESVIGKLIAYYKFRRKTLRLLNKIYSEDPNRILWIEGAYTMISLGKAIKKYRYILYIVELNDKFKLQMRAVKKLIYDAELVIMPEYHRTILYQVWFGLKKRPAVLSNKPYFIPSNEELNIIAKNYQKELEVFSKKKVILYQGKVHPERDLSPFLKAISNLGDEYQVVILGDTHPILSQYKRILPSLIHINFIPAPDYLVFTRMCYLGIVTYDPLEFNTTFCAPNKIYEYACFGKPMIGNDIPGLKIVEDGGAGLLVDESNVEEIQNAITIVNDNYNDFSQKARKFYQDTDNKSVLKKTLKL